MDIVRRNTDYALRLMVGLARHRDDESVSTRSLAQEQEVSYDLACKLMQQLHRAKLVGSCMGPKGGFRLGREPTEITLLEIIQAVQGPLSVNRCVLGEVCCPRRQECPVRAKMGELQDRMEDYLGNVTLEELVSSREATPQGKEKWPKKGPERACWRPAWPSPRSWTA